MNERMIPVDPERKTLTGKAATQERILEAVEETATSGGYDYVLDKSSSTIFLFYRDQYDLSIDVLEEMGIDTESMRATTGN